VVKRTRVDPGQTVLPSLIQLDTSPGRQFTGETIGHRVHAFADKSGTIYRDGYYVLSGTDHLDVNWTNGVVGMTLQLRMDDAIMRGRASAWTDYRGEEQASIVLRRADCPGAR